MKKQLLAFAILAASVAYVGCDKIDPPGETPKCIEHLINEFENGEACKSDASVEKHLFQGEAVYLFNPGNCGADLGANVYDSDCNLLGFLGGIAGNTKINGDEFSNAILLETIWEN